MKGKNLAIVRGNLTDKPKMRYTKTKDPVAWFIIASNYPVRSADGSGWEKGVDYIPVLCFKKIAALAEKYLDKGSAVECEGRLKNDEWTDPKTGKKSYRLIFIVTDITLLGRPKDAAENEAEEYQEAEPIAVDEIPDGPEVYDYTPEEIDQALVAKNYATYQ